MAFFVTFQTPLTKQLNYVISNSRVPNCMPLLDETTQST